MDFFAEGFREAWRLVAARDPVVFHALGVTTTSAILAVLLASLVALPYGAWLGIARPRGHRAQAFVLRILLFVPTVVIGLVLYGFLSRRGVLGSLELMYTRTAITIGLTVLAVPLLATHAQGACAGLDRIVADEARTLGAGSLRMIRLGLGEVRPALVTALLTALARCAAEVGIALILGGGIKLETRTLPAEVQIALSMGEFGRGLASGSLVLLLAVAAAVAAELAGGERR